MIANALPGPPDAVHGGVAWRAYFGGNSKAVHFDSLWRPEHCPRGGRGFASKYRKTEMSRRDTGSGSELVRALLAIEWDDVNAAARYCRHCDQMAPGAVTDDWHRPTCVVSKALTAAGLPDQASRDALRKEIGIVP